MFSPFVGGMMKQAVRFENCALPIHLQQARKQSRQDCVFQYMRIKPALISRGRISQLFSRCFDPKIQNPHTVNVYLGVQHSLTSTMVLETAFVGNRGIKYPLHRVFNQVDRVAAYDDFRSRRGILCR